MFCLLILDAKVGKNLIICKKKTEKYAFFSFFLAFLFSFQE